MKREVKKKLSIWLNSEITQATMLLLSEIETLEWIYSLNKQKAHQLKALRVTESNLGHWIARNRVKETKSEIITLVLLHTIEKLEWTMGTSPNSIWERLIQKIGVWSYDFGCGEALIGDETWRQQAYWNRRSVKKSLLFAVSSGMSLNNQNRASFFFFFNT